jgi:hypothetical protein
MYRKLLVTLAVLILGLATSMLIAGPASAATNCSGVTRNTEITVKNYKVIAACFPASNPTDPTTEVVNGSPNCTFTAGTNCGTTCSWFGTHSIEGCKSNGSWFINDVRYDKGNMATFDHNEAQSWVTHVVNVYESNSARACTAGALGGIVAASGATVETGGVAAVLGAAGGCLTGYLTEEWLQ